MSVTNPPGRNHFSLAAALSTIVPTWLANVPGFRMLYAFCHVLAKLGDQLRGVAMLGQMAALPGQGTPTALPLLAQSRGLVQGPREPNAVFAARLIAFREAHARDGSALGLVQELQAYLYGFGLSGTYPIVHWIDRSGWAVHLQYDGTVTYDQQTGFNWDQTEGYVDGVGYHSGATVSTWLSDGWVFVQDPFQHFTTFSDPNWVAAWRGADCTLDGFTCTQEIVQGLKTIIASAKGAHVFVRGVYWVGNPGVDGISPGNWGNASQNISGQQYQQRTAAFGYWDMNGG